MSAFYISAAHKSSGKTTLSIGLGAAIQKRGLAVQAFKKGPDYIDPIWLGQATGNPCYNLDFFTSSRDFILDQFRTHAWQKDVTMVEGNMGLHDGLSLDGSDSNAAMVKLLDIPVIMVIDCSGTSRGIAPLLNGYQQFDPELRFAGVIMNKVAGNRHETKLREVIEAYTDFKILGAVPRNRDIQLSERHLGLIPGNEMAEQSAVVIDQLALQANQYIDIDQLLSLSDSSRLDHKVQIAATQTVNDSNPRLRIAVAMDQAFGFYYPGDLDRFKALNIELVPFSTISDSHLPENIDGLFIGGGFPETQLEQVSGNTSMLQSVKQAIDQKMPCYAECGGLMYLCRDLVQDSRHFALCNVIAATVSMNTRPQGRGYVKLQATDSHPWFEDETHPQPIETHAHEFHYSSIKGLPKDTQYAYTLKRGTGIDGINDGIVINNLLASYTHLRQTDSCQWVDRFISFVDKVKRNT